MKIPFIDLKRQYERLAPELEPRVIECLRSTQYIGGPYVKDLESNLAKYLDVKHVIACANGTDALMIALRAGLVKPGDEVITTPFSFFATAEAISAVGAVPVFVDVRESDFNIDPKLVEAAVTDRTKAILPVHIFGTAAPMDELNAIGKRCGIKVIEDSAQGIGTQYKGRKAGTLGDVGCFSFYPTKNLGAYGDAGMITTNDDTMATIAMALREHGAGKSGAVAREHLYGRKAELGVQQGADAHYDPYKYYNFVTGYNSRLDALQAVILNTKLPYLDTYNQRRNDIAKYYGERLKDVCIVPSFPEGGVSCWHQYAIRTERKYELIDHMAEYQIGTGAFYPVPLHLQKAYTPLGYKAGSLPVAESLCSETVCLPMFPELTDAEVQEVAAQVRSFFDGVKA